MFKKFLSLFSFASLSLSALDPQIPAVVDMGKFPTMQAGYYANFNFDVWRLGGYSFNYAPELAPFFALLKRCYKLDTVVETGTFVGGTTVVFSFLFDSVHTLEIDPNHFRISSELLAPYKNVTCHKGSSEIVMKDLLPTLKDHRVLFYLDAHWQSHWPLLEELQEISKTHKNNCIIVVDDFKVPGRADIPFDAYGPHECSINYIKGELDKIFTSYDVHYLIPKSIYSRAKAVIIPKGFCD